MLWLRKFLDLVELPTEDANNIDRYEDLEDCIKFYLSQEPSYIKFLDDNAIWGLVTEPNRGVDLLTKKDLKTNIPAAQKSAQLNRMPGIIVQFAPPQ